LLYDRFWLKATAPVTAETIRAVRPDFFPARRTGAFVALACTLAAALVMAMQALGSVRPRGAASAPQIPERAPRAAPYSPEIRIGSLHSNTGAAAPSRGSVARLRNEDASPAAALFSNLSPIGRV
jgi:hypothetical protein